MILHLLVLVSQAFFIHFALSRTCLAGIDAQLTSFSEKIPFIRCDSPQVPSCQHSPFRIPTSSPKTQIFSMAYFAGLQPSRFEYIEVSRQFTGLN